MGATVRTTGLRLGIQSASSDSSLGLYEWAVHPHAGPAPAATARPADLWLDDLIPVSATVGDRKSYRVNKYS